MAKYRSVLTVPGASALFLSAVAGRLPQGMSSLAILLLVRASTHSYATAGLAVGANALAGAVCVPLIGRLVDHFGRTRVLAPFAFAQAGVYVALVLAAGSNASPVVLVLLAGLAGALLPPIAPAVRALLGEVFDDPRIRDTAYALDAVIQEVVWIGGPLLVAVAVAVFSASGAVVMLGVVCTVGTCLFVRSPLARDRSRRAHQERRSALASPQLRALLGPIALTGAGLGAIEVGLPSLALHAGSRPASGLLLAMWSVGSLTGGLWYGARHWQWSLAGRYRSLLLLAVICSAPLIVARSIPAGVICSVLAGLTIAPMFTCQYALVARTVRAGSETEAFTWVSAALVGGIAAGSAAGGAVIASGGVGAPFELSCLATLLAAAVALGFRRRVPQSAQI